MGGNQDHQSVNSFELENIQVHLLHSKSKWADFSMPHSILIWIFSWSRVVQSLEINYLREANVNQGRFSLSSEVTTWKLVLEIKLLANSRGA